MMRGRWLFIAMLSLSSGTWAGAADPALSVQQTENAVTVRLGDVDLLTYVFRDSEVSRPYFAPVRTPSGIQVSRNHPPIEGSDKTDHRGLHTGIWLSFGDLSGHDYWRLKARTEHLRFITPPTVTAHVVQWSVVNRYLSADKQRTVCEETASYSVRLVDHGYLLDLTSEFRPGDREIVFGDQEEMGLGIRLNSSLAVDKNLGGRILDSEGRRNGNEVWGKTSRWCDYSGPLESRWAGMAVFSDPENFRPSWNHARDYGFLAVNPFGRASFTQGEPSRVVVKPGETLRIRFGVYVHETATEVETPINTVYDQFAAPKPAKSR